MSERVMLDWVDSVLKPWALGAPDGVRPLLMLDSYRCHTLASVREAIQASGVELVVIPGGCTCLCQPVDVGINKPFKNYMQEKWVYHLISRRHEAVNGKIPAPTREELVQWVIDCKDRLTDITVLVSKQPRVLSLLSLI